MDQNCKILLAKDKINVQDALDFVSSPHCGGTSFFIGTTRINEKDDCQKKVVSLNYESYEEMALLIMNEIVDKLVNSVDGIHKVYVYHRLGQVKLGEESIIIAVSSPHRSTCHQMVMQILNEIKQTVPIWKQVCYEDNKDQSENIKSLWSEKSEAFWLSN